MTHDEAEFLMSQQLDGTLDAADATRLRAAIDADALLAAMWREHQTLDAALRGSRVASEPFSSDADPMTSRIAALLDADAEQPRVEVKTFASPHSFKLAAYRWSTPLAAAAMLAIGLSIGIFTARTGSNTTHSPNGQPEVAVAPHVGVGPSVAINSIPTIALSGAIDDSTTPMSSKGMASFTVGTPANLSASYVTSLYVADRSAGDRVVIEGVGRSTGDVFD